MEEIKIENAALKVVKDLMPSISAMFGGDECLALSDTEKFIYYVMGTKYNMPYQIGDKLGPTVKSTIEKRVAAVYPIPEDIVPGGVECAVLPIFENGEVVGLLCLTNHLANRRKLCELSDNLANTVSNMAKTMNGSFKNIHSLSEMNTNLLAKTDETVKRVGDTERVVHVVKDISAQTNLLGLNASIEAARAGELGKGFSIVASEIRNLARTSKDSIEEISEISKCISDSSLELNKGIHEVNAAFTKHLSDLQKIMDSLAELETTFEQLNLLSDHI